MKYRHIWEAAKIKLYAQIFGEKEYKILIRIMYKVVRKEKV